MVSDGSHLIPTPLTLGDANAAPTAHDAFGQEALWQRVRLHQGRQVIPRAAGSVREVVERATRGREAFEQG